MKDAKMKSIREHTRTIRKQAMTIRKQAMTERTTRAEPIRKSESDAKS
jgi:hypothetical protein